jgi:DNA-binding NarL/FixJ family response regulator
VDLLAKHETRKSRRRPPTIVVVERRILIQSCVLRLLKRELSKFHVWGATSAGDLSGAHGLDVKLVAVDLEDRPLGDPTVKLELTLISEMYPRASVVVISDCEDAAAAQDVLRWGVRGYFPSSLAIDVLVAGFRLVIAGGVYCPPPVTLQQGPADAPARIPQLRPGHSSVHCDPRPIDIGVQGDDVPSVALTRRETEVIAELQLGHSNKVIALNLGMSENTVKMHIQHLMRKLGARTRTEAVFRWARGGAITHSAHWMRSQ